MDIENTASNYGPQGNFYGSVNIGESVSLPPALHQLRAPVNDFVGRDAEITQLVTALRQAAEGGTVAAISGVRGMGGIGKTELAYRVVQEVYDAFPDAQLLIELRGAGDNPLPPS